MKIEFGSRWISKGKCIARVVEATDESVITRWEGAWDDLCDYHREEFLDVFRPYDGYLKESLPVEMNSLWWYRSEEGDIKRAIVVGYLDGLVLLHDDEGDVSANPVTEFEGFRDDDQYCWSRGNPIETNPRAEMEAKMAAIQAELDELKRLLGR
jgi:hypothetical protein